MNWDDLRYFLAVCREGTVTKAARVLDVNHTTVARRVNALEGELGTRLFDRTNDGYAMMQSAENMYAHALEIEQRAQAIDRELFGRDVELKGSLKLTVAHDVSNILIVPSIPAFKNEYPCIDIELLTTTGLVDLAAREADLAVRLTAKPPDYLIGRKVMPIRHGVYGSPEYLRRSKEPRDVILFRGATGYPEWVRRHFPNAQLALRVDDVGTMREAVKNHLGLARLPCYIGDSDSNIRRLDLELTPSSWGVWVLSHTDLRSTARVRVCRECLFDVLAAQRALILGEDSTYYE